MKNSKSIVIAKYLFHVFMACVAVICLCGVLELILGLPFKASDRPLDYVFWGPTFVAPILMAVFLGRRMGLLLPTRSTRALWLVPILPFASEAWQLYKGTNLWPGGLQPVISNLFGASCGASECLGELLLSAPLIASIAYGIGAELAYYHLGRSPDSSESVGTVPARP